jgi:hypothetical protein
MLVTNMYHKKRKSKAIGPVNASKCPPKQKAISQVRDKSKRADDRLKYQYVQERHKSLLVGEDMKGLNG